MNLKAIKEKYSHQKEFLQAVEEVFKSVTPLFEEDEKYAEVFERIIVPERVIIFKVNWLDDNNKMQTNTGYRVEFNSALGPYKGGLRFDESVNLSIMKFLAFEQIFKNALTNLQIGGAKGGSDFSPKNKSDGEILRFSQAFMSELFKYISPTSDVPAGDMGVGQKEIGYLFGMYKKLTNKFEGSLTGKGVDWGGSYVRKEATGYGSVYFAREHLKVINEDLKGKICCVSGAGNVAIYTMQKLYELGAKPIACSDRSGTIYHKRGIDVDLLIEIKEKKRLTLKEYANHYPEVEFIPNSEYKDYHPIWSIKCDIAFPSATQNELNLKDAKNLVKNGCLLVNEGANMPTTPKAIEYLKENEVLFSPAKAANAGGVAVSQLEMAQNASMTKWSFEKVDKKLQEIMKNIFEISYNTAKQYGKERDLVTGANIYSFKKVANAMIAQGM